MIAYYDDLIEWKSYETVVNVCSDYAKNWKMVFNAAKSVSYKLDDRSNLPFRLKDSVIPKYKCFTYLGLPFGDTTIIEGYRM